MADIRDLRKLLNTKQDVIDFQGTPSTGGMTEGQIALSKSTGGQLAIHRKKYGKLWKSYMSYNGDQYVDRNMFVKNNIIYSGFLRNHNYPSFSAYLSTSADAQTVADSTNTRVNFDTEEYDMRGNYDTSAYKFTAPIAGIYHFDTRILWDGNTDLTAGDWTAGERHDVWFVKNADGTTPSSSNRVAADIGIVSGTLADSILMNNLSADLKLDSGDYITVAVWQNSSTNQYTYDPAGTSLWSSFTGHLVTGI